jgi:predicted nucleotidyltransferase
MVPVLRQAERTWHRLRVLEMVRPMGGRVALPTDEIAAICRRFGVERLDLVGSGARGTDFDPAKSDLDFVVSFLPAPDRPSFGDFIELEAELAAATGRKVDLIAAGSVRNPYVRASMDRDRVTVHEA